MLRRYSFFIVLGLLLSLAGCATTSQPRHGFTSDVNIKAGRTVAVLPGETLYSFARRNKASMRELIDLNQLQAPYVLARGSTLKLPVLADDLPSVELGPLAAENEKEYKQKHRGKPVTTYTQVAPEPNPEAKPTEHKTAIPQLASPKSELQAEASNQFTKPVEPVTKVTPPAETLNLKPMQFDASRKHLAEQVKPSAPSKQASAKTPKPTQAKSDPNDVDVRAVKLEQPIPSQPVEEKKTELKQGTVDVPKKSEREMHSRIEKQAEPKNIIWPVQGTVISTYGPKPSGLKNDGINIAVPRGTPVLVADGGTVAYAGSDIPGYGNVVLVRHPNGLMTTYAHLERMFVQENIVVAKGDLVGTVGTSGGVDTPQLHFEIRRDKEALDPGKYLYR